MSSCAYIPRVAWRQTEVPTSPNLRELAIKDRIKDDKYETEYVSEPPIPTSWHPSVSMRNNYRLQHGLQLIMRV